MKANPNLNGVVTDASGIATVEGHGRGFVVLPGGAFPGGFPLMVYPVGCERTPHVPVAGPQAIYLNQAFRKLRLEGTPNATYFVWIMGTNERVELGDLLGVVGPRVTQHYTNASTKLQTDGAAATNPPSALSTAHVGYFPLATVRAFTVVVSAPATRVLADPAADGSMCIHLWRYFSTLARWVQLSAANDQQVEAGARDWGSKEIVVETPAAGDFMYVEAFHCGVSAGAGLTIYTSERLG